jgi:hypothetical protein
VENSIFCGYFGFPKDKVKPLAVIMDKLRQSLPVCVTHSPARKYSNCHITN